MKGELGVLFYDRKKMDIGSLIFGIVGVIGTIIGGVGVALTIISNKKNKELKSISWGDLSTAVSTFYKKLNKESFIPDIIVTPGQKGGIIAQMLGDLFSSATSISIPILTGAIFEDNYSGSIEGYEVLETTKWKVFIPKCIFSGSLEVKNKLKILIIDDFVMSGDFLNILKNRLIKEGFHADKIKSCGVAITQVSIDAKKNPDYYYKIVNDRDFYFPWGEAR